MSETTDQELQDRDVDDEEGSDQDPGLEGDPDIEADDPQEAIERLQEERDKFREKYLRKVADFENLRKRKQKELEDKRKYANQRVLKDLLEVVDNFERAMESMSFENEDVREGNEMIHQQLVNLLERHDVRQIEAEGEPFDPHRHEGMMQEEREDLEDARVLEVFKKGYLYHDRVLRPARVKVGVPPSDADEEQPPENEETSSADGDNDEVNETGA